MALYSDTYISCDEHGVTIRLYYFPIGLKKVVPYAEIQRLETWKMGAFTGRYRIWGGSPWHWLNCDPGRPRKELAIILVTDAFTRPVVTPDDPQAFIEALKSKISDLEIVALD